MGRLARFALAALALLAVQHALAQGVTVLQGGPFTAGHIPEYVGAGSSQPVVQDGGGAGGGLPGVNPSEIGITARGTGTPPFAGQGTGAFGANFCDLDAPTNNATGYHYFCLSANAQGGPLMAVGAGGVAAALPFKFIVNGTTYTFPFTVGGITGPAVSTVGHIATWNNSIGTLLADGGAFSFANLTGTVSCNQLPALTGNVTSVGCATTIGAGAVLSSMLSTGAASSNIGALGGVLSGTLPNPTISPNSITTAMIANQTIISADIATNTLAYSNIAQAAANTVVGNPTSGIANLQNMAMPSCSGGTQASNWTTSSGFGCATIGATIPTSPIRQTVAGGPVQTTPTPGAPNFLPATSVSLSLTMQNVSSSFPFVATAANGYGANGPIDVVGFSTSNLTWSSLSNNSTLYLYVTIAANGTMTTGFTALPPIYQYGGTPATTNGQFTFNIGQMQGFMGNGATAPQANIVFVGQVVTGASTVTSTLAYSYNGQIDTPLVQLAAAAATDTIFNHNLGVTPAIAQLVSVCSASNVGYVPGQQVLGLSNFNGAALAYANVVISPSTAALIGSSATNGYALPNATTGSFSGLTSLDWGVFLRVRRGWGGA
jgi:hypothetical protein